MKFRVYADILMSAYYEFEAPNKFEAQKLVDEEEIEPTRLDQISSPVIVHVEEIKKK